MSTARAAYIHVPFCKHRCGYCDFAVIAGREDLVEPYLRAVAIELAQLATPQEIDTLYLGGGTPSYLSADALTVLCREVLRWHPLACGYEWTIEANPEHVTKEFIDLAAAMGVTRVSLGVQSFDCAKLRTLDRQHSDEQARRSVELVMAGGLAACVDLIFAAPGETRAGWEQDLRAAIELHPEHISTYGLTYERGTAFAVARDRGSLDAADEDLERDMYLAAIQTLESAGFEHYEVSNFARGGVANRSRHNENYWAGGEYYAAGPGAARHLGGVRETNTKSTTAYVKRMLAGESPVADRETLTAEQRGRERLVLGLRRLEGVNANDFHRATGFEVEELAGEAIKKFVALGLLEFDGERLRLTREGLLVSDAMWVEMV